MKDEDIGYLKRAVEDLSASTKLLHQIVKDHMAQEELDRKELLEQMKNLRGRIEVLEDEALVNRAILKTLKWIGGVVVAIFMVNLGDVSGLLKIFG